MSDRGSSFDYEQLLACARGDLFGPGNAQLPLPPLLMFDKIAEISEDGGPDGKGLVRAEFEIRPDHWFFGCHFKNDPVMPGCLGLDALWQLLGFYLGWLGLPGRGLDLPVRALHEYLTIELTAGQESTRATTDTIADIFVPGHLIYHAFRPGRQLVLPVGSILRAQTAATVDASNVRAVVLSTPPPFTSTYDTPHADLTPAPIYTPAPDRPRPLPKGKPTLPPTPKPTPTPTDEPSAAVSPGASPTSAAPSAGPPLPAPSPRGT